MEEIWKAIKNYEGLYEVSNLGRIKSLHYYGGDRQVILSQFTRQDGYKTVNLAKNGKHRTHTIHRLVADAFIQNPNNLEMVNHKDENTENNCVDNLEWCTRSYNQIYSMNLHEERRKVFGNNFKKNGINTSPFTKKGNPHSCFRAVVQKDLKENIIARYKNPAEAKLITGIKDISIVCNKNENKIATRQKKRNGTYKYTLKGFIFEYE